MNNNKRATKRALLTSVTALVMCVVMLAGTTFAWFTDTASTGVNKIQAGNLKVSLVNEDGDDLTNKTIRWTRKDANNKTETIAENGLPLWEPGATYRTEWFYIRNDGNLALKYKISVNGFTGDTELLDVLDFTVLLSGATVEGSGTKIFYSLDDLASYEGHLLPESANIGNHDFSTVGIKITAKMKESAGNKYQGMSLEGIGITVLATQYTYESDSTGKDYDKDAEYPVVSTAADADTFTAAIEKAKNDGVPAKIALSGDVSNVDLNGGDVTVDVADRKLTIKRDETNNAPTISNGSVTITGADGNKLGNNKIVVDSAVLTIGVGLADSNSYQAVPFEVRNGGTLNITKGDNSSVGYQSMLVKASGTGTVANISGGGFASDGSEATFVAANDGAVVNVSGGTFSGSGSSQCVFYANGGTIVISGCTASSFAGAGTQIFKVANGGKIIVTGGTFAADPSAYVNTETHTVANTSGTYTVTAK